MNERNRETLGCRNGGRTGGANDCPGMARALEWGESIEGEGDWASATGFWPSRR